MGRESQTASPQQEAKYKMPSIRLGQTVLWRHQPHSDPETAVVTQVGSGQISVTVFPAGSRVGVTKNGCRHISDPSLPRVVHHEGVWDYTDWDKKILAVIE